MVHEVRSKFTTFRMFREVRFAVLLLEDFLGIILSIAALGSIGADIVRDLHGAKPVPGAWNVKNM